MGLQPQHHTQPHNSTPLLTPLLLLLSYSTPPPLLITKHIPIEASSFYIFTWVSN